MASSSNESAQQRAFRAPALLLAVALSASTGCGQEFTSCSETHSCGEQGGTSGDGGSGASGGSVSGESGSSGASGASSGEDCPSGCDDDETCCDGECVDTSADVLHCGACNNRCEGAHAQFECIDSECAIESCTKGFVDCGSVEDGCESEDEGLPDVPAPLLPMAGAYTGAVRAESSLKPKFAWQASEATGSCGGVTYEIELTRECEPGKLQDCGFDEPDVRESGLESPEFTPEDPLPVSDDVPVGALYAWRVRACDGPERCSAWSRVSYANVGRLIDDINADGYSDVVEVGEDDEVAGVFLMGDGATPLAAHMTIEIDLGAPTHGRLLGDVNGDAFPDMVLWSSWTTDAPRVVLGASSPQDWTSRVMSSPLQLYHRGGRAGDLDADGFADVAISEFELASTPVIPKAVVRLYRGRSDFDLVGSLNLLPPSGTTVPQFGAALAGGFDSNADGYSDLVIMDDDEGALHFVRGKSSFPSAIDASIKSATLPGVSSSDYTELCAIGDRDGDGYGDIAAFVRTLDGGLLQTFSGGAEPSPEPTAHLQFTSNTYAIECVGGYDLGGDGRDELFVHVLESLDAASYVRALPGSSEEQTADDSFQVDSFGSASFFAGGLIGGDYDGDGALDLKIRLAEKINLLRGGKPASTSANCSQPETSFSLIGDWCSVEKDDLSTPPYETRTPVR